MEPSKPLTPLPSARAAEELPDLPRSGEASAALAHSLEIVRHRKVMLRLSVRLLAYKPPQARCMHT